MSKRRPGTHEVRITPEPSPDEEALARIERFEEHVGDDGERDLEGMSLEAAGEFLRAILPGKLHGYDLGPMPPEPTQTEPGSPERIKVLRGRARSGHTLHHPDDKKLPRGVWAPAARAKRLAPIKREVSDD